jgi:hypothetical protein
MSGEKSSPGKNSSTSVMNSVVAQKRSPPLSHTGSQASGLRRPIVLAHSARRKTGGEDLDRRKALELIGCSVSCFSLEFQETGVVAGGAPRRRGRGGGGAAGWRSPEAHRRRASTMEAVGSTSAKRLR